MSLAQDIKVLFVFRRLIDTIKKGDKMTLLPSILAAVAGIASIFSPQIQGAVTSHPAVAGIIGSLYAILSHFLPSPIQGGNQK